MIKITKLEDIANITTYERIKDLLSQLYPQNPQITKERFERVVGQTRNNIYIASENGVIVGTASMYNYEKLGGNVFVIEDVVVDQDSRGKGIGKSLTDKLVEVARESGASFIDVNTRRKDARDFYIEKCGFIDKNENPEHPLYSLRKYLK